MATAGVAVVASATANITAGDPNIQFSSAQGSSGGNSPKERPETENINLDNKPKANSSKLQNFINSLYKGQGNPNQIGNGTTMDSIRYELETGNPVEGKFHSQKGQEFINGNKNARKFWVFRPKCRYSVGINRGVYTFITSFDCRKQPLFR